MPTMDGNVFGTKLRRIPAMKGIESCRLCAWNRQQHSEYMLLEVNPSKDINISNRIGYEWSDSSVLLFCRVEMISSPFDDKDDFTDFGAVSVILPLAPPHRDFPAPGDNVDDYFPPDPPHSPPRPDVPMNAPDPPAPPGPPAPPAPGASDAPMKKRVKVVTPPSPPKHADKIYQE